MIKEIINLLRTRWDFFLNLAYEHLFISFVAIIIAIILGAILGILISEYRKSSKFTLAFINFLYTIPSISMLGFLIPLSGIGNTTAIIALSLYALLPMVKNTYTGITNVDKNIIEAAEGMGSTRWQILSKIKLPLAVPVIMSGIHNMVVMTIALAGIASFIGAGGLGVAIYRGITTNNAVMTFTGSLLIALIALFFDFLLSFLEKRLTKRNRNRNKNKKSIFNKVYLTAFALLIAILFSVNALFFNNKKEVVNIATKPMTEQYIIGEMLKILIEENSNLKVNLTQGVGGGTSNIQPAMVKGEFDIYPEYTGTSWNMVLKNKDLYTEEKFSVLEKGYKENYKFSLITKYGFNNSYALAVRKQIANKYNLKTISDLSRVSKDLIFGAEYDFFEREDGYKPLNNKYNMSFKSTMDLDIGLKYDAINSKKIDVMPIFTTDGKISVSDIVVLEDDKHFYPSYKAVNVVREDIINKHPEIKEILLKLENKITDEDMVKLNYEVEGKKLEPKEVAKRFLQEKNLLKKGGN